MAFIEQTIRTAIVSALKQLEFKKYDVEREDFIDMLSADMQTSREIDSNACPTDFQIMLS